MCRLFWHFHLCEVRFWFCTAKIVMSVWYLYSFGRVLRDNFNNMWLNVVSLTIRTNKRYHLQTDTCNWKHIKRRCVRNATNVCTSQKHTFTPTKNWHLTAVLWFCRTLHAMRYGSLQPFKGNMGFINVGSKYADAWQRNSEIFFRFLWGIV